MCRRGGSTAKMHKRDAQAKADITKQKFGKQKAERRNWDYGLRTTDHEENAEMLKI